jgi:hypothetical protein
MDMLPELLAGIQTGRELVGETSLFSLALHLEQGEQAG